MGGFDYHMFICSHERDPDAVRECCSHKNSLELMKAIKIAAKTEGIQNIRVQKAGCLGKCEQGISCVVYPEGTWYTLTGEGDIPDMLEHLRTGKKAHHLVME
ncbi:MAG: (2Fe-2S) ferredoxin domain-containing protein [Candidatus Thermoplasmatota archaeon]|nr:(2Fe-2S) ferredoxin domain-containing protein [Candidatus Thermoplasmatota archaeon]